MLMQLCIKLMDAFLQNGFLGGRECREEQDDKKSFHVEANIPLIL